MKLKKLLGWFIIICLYIGVCWFIMPKAYNKVLPYFQAVGLLHLMFLGAILIFLILYFSIKWILEY